MTDNLNDEIFAALVSKKPTRQNAGAAGKSKQDQVSAQEKQEYLMRYINLDGVSLEDRIAVGSVLLLHGLESILQEGNEGTMVVMKNIPPHVIDQMYTMMQYKINPKG